MELRSIQTTACARKRNKWKRVKSPPETLEKEQGDAKGKKMSRIKEEPGERDKKEYMDNLVGSREVT